MLPTPRNLSLSTKVTGAEVDRLRRARDEKESILRQLQEKQRIYLKVKPGLAASLKKNVRLRTLRSFFDSTTTRIGGFINIVILSGALPLVVLGLMRFSFAPYLALAAVAGASVWSVRLFKPSDDKLESAICTQESNVVGLDESIRGLDRSIPRAHADFTCADEAFQRANAVFRSRINRLRNTPWQDLAGIPFEEFLADLFAEYGYGVETTKTTGDQGVDLVLRTANRRIAIQAKGYPHSTVGNSAIQEAHTGMVFYGCQVAVVITNSSFTSAARDLASKVGCILIDGSQIPALIEGQIRI
jgi:hypothetical protein